MNYSSANSLPKIVSAARTSAKPVPYSIQLRAQQCIAKYIQLATSIYQQSFNMPSVAFDLRGRTAGTATYATNVIRLNAVLLIENEEAFVSRTIPHEVAHLVTRKVYGMRVSSHGPEWRSVMQKFGVDASRCHAYDTTNSAVGGVHSYKCGCRIHQLGVRQHKSALRGLLKCNSCKRVLVPANGQTATPVIAAKTSMTTSRSAPAPALSSPAPLSHKVSPATPAMRKFAEAIAARLHIVPTQAILDSYQLCAEFIQLARKTSSFRARMNSAATEGRLAFCHTSCYNRIIP